MSFKRKRCVFALVNSRWCARQEEETCFWLNIYWLFPPAQGRCNEKQKWERFTWTSHVFLFILTSQRKTWKEQPEMYFVYAPDCQKATFQGFKSEFSKTGNLNSAKRPTSWLFYSKCYFIAFYSREESVFALLPLSFSVSCLPGPKRN